MIKTRNQNRIIQQKNQFQKVDKNKPYKQIKCILKNNISEIQTDTQQILQKDKNIPLYQTSLIKNKIITKIDQNFQIIQPYEEQIMDYLKNLQSKYRINEDYIKFHKKLTPKLRNFMIQFIFRVCLKFKCQRKTIFLAVYCFDFYLAKNLAIEDQQRIVSTAQASLHIAMKYQEIYPPSLKQWTSSKHYEQILKCESQILKSLDFKLNLPSIYYFEQYFLHRSSSGNQIISYEPSNLNKMKVKLISDICLFDIGLYAYSAYDLTLNIIRLVNNIQAPFKEQRIVLNIKWAIERNSNLVEWLKQNFYKQSRDD